MAYLIQALIAFLVSLTPTLVAKAMAALGFGYFVYSGVKTLCDAYITDMVGNYNATPSIIMQFLMMAGFSDVIYIMTGALSASVSVMAVKAIRSV